MNDIEKSDIKRKNSGKRMRRRKRMMSIYVFIVMFLVFSVGVTMCFTFLFNVDEIVISGESETYTYMEIVEASEVRAGDNLFRLNTKAAADKILDKLLYVETANVHRDFPNTLRITVTRCIPAYNIQHDTGVLLVSRKGKILANNNFYTDEDKLPVIRGLQPDSLETGVPLNSVNANKYDAFTQIISRFDHDDNREIASIDLTNEYDIIVQYRNGVTFKLGNWSDVEYKLDLAQNVMQDESIQGKKGVLTMIGSKQCSFRSTGEQETAEPAEGAEGQDSTENNGNDLQKWDEDGDQWYDGNWGDDGTADNGGWDGSYDDGTYDGGYYDGGYDGGYYDEQW